MFDQALLNATVEFWNNFKMLIAEAVFMGIISAHLTMMVGRWLLKAIKNAGLPNHKRED